MEKNKEFQTGIALVIGLAIIPMNRWIYGVLALSFLVLAVRLVSSWSTNWARWVAIVLTILVTANLLIPQLAERF